GIVQHMFGMVLETSPEPYNTKADFVEQLRGIAKRKIELFVSEEFINLSRVIMPEALHNPQKMQEAMAQMSAIESDMVNWFQQAINDNKIKEEDAADVCFTFMGIVKMDSYWSRLLKGRPVPSKNEIDNMVEKAITIFCRYYFND
ncbi:MAG: TetR/AcrR family transcriptional regulator C-terminal domain-containing protein, partial [Kangiellaceae bacterium]|nr:TetR/AcrR family transcriptional regulator C-terminal domain-containing protein [Kangiellaceae bacterium]